MDLEKAVKQTYDVCIIGSGPAGIIVALEFTFLNLEKKVVLLEYGYPDQPSRNSLDDAIVITNPVNHYQPYESTNKGLGGTSATWGGRCVMYDEVDFTDRQILNGGCTWDKSLYQEILTYTTKAAAYFECGAPVFNLHKLPGLGAKRIAEGFKEGIITDSSLERWSMPTRFRTRYQHEIAKRQNLIVVQGAEARDFGIPDTSGQIKSLTVRDVKTQAVYQIKAHKFVIAAGAQESTRLLLRNPQLFKCFKSVPVALGKYYVGHLSGKIASVKFNGNPQKTSFGFDVDADGTYIRRRLQFKEDFLVKHNLLNTSFWLDNPLYFDPAHKSGAMSFMYLAMLVPFLGKRLAPPAIAHTLTKGRKYKLGNHAWNILRNMPASLLIPAWVFYKRYCIKRKLPGVFLYSQRNKYALHFHAEQVPVVSNQMTLAPDGETLIINYEVTDADISSVIQLHSELDKWLQQCNCGKLEYWYPENEQPEIIRKITKDGIHQCGTTRIADSPEKGVVNRNLKVWGTENIYVCSSSVFPTSGQANPTFMLGAFAVRLAQYLTCAHENS